MGFFTNIFLPLSTRIEGVKMGMSREDVIGVLGKPRTKNNTKSVNSKGVEEETDIWIYADSKKIIGVGFEEGKVKCIKCNDVLNPNMLGSDILKLQKHF